MLSEVTHFKCKDMDEEYIDEEKYISFTDIADFNARKVIRDKEGHYIIIEGSIVQEDTTTLNVYKPPYRVSNYVRQNLRELKRE